VFFGKMKIMENTEKKLEYTEKKLEFTEKKFFFRDFMPEKNEKFQQNTENFY
jgi:hypothetical protein